MESRPFDTFPAAPASPASLYGSAPLAPLADPDPIRAAACVGALGDANKLLAAVGVGRETEALLEFCIHVCVALGQSVDPVPFTRDNTCVCALNEFQRELTQLHTTLLTAHRRSELAGFVQNPSTFRLLRREVASLFVRACNLGKLVVSGRMVRDLPSDATIVTAFRTLSAAITGCTPSDFVDGRVLSCEDAVRFWVTKFKASCVAVPVAEFVKAVASYTMALSPGQEESLRAVLDDAGAKLVSVYKFNEFVTAFGTTVDTAVKNLDRSMQEAWFHGFLSYDEANEVLRCCPVGTFLIRFSESSPKSLALTYVAAGSAVRHVKIEPVPGRGFEMDRAYSSLRDIVDANASVLSRPAPGGLKNCKYFHGILTFPETEALLAGKSAGTYLLRFSRSQPGSLVVGYVSPTGAALQCLIHPNPDGYGYVLGDKRYNTLDEIIHTNSAVLKTPLLASQFSSVMPEMPIVPTLTPNTLVEHSSVDAYGRLVAPPAPLLSGYHEGPLTGAGKPGGPPPPSLPLPHPSAAAYAPPKDYMPRPGELVRTPSVEPVMSSYGPMMSGFAPLPASLYAAPPTVSFPPVGTLERSLSETAPLGLPPVAPGSMLPSLPQTSLYSSLPEPAMPAPPSLPLTSQASSTEGRLCPVCLEAKPKWVVLLPCGHPLCTECVEKLHSKKCAMCMQVFTGYNPLYL